MEKTGGEWNLRFLFVTVLALAGVGTWLLMSESPAEKMVKGDAAASPRQNKDVSSSSERGEAAASPSEGPLPPAEAKVEAFDNLTDKWMEPAKVGVTMKDVDGFVAAFRQVPKGRRDECIHRALNLIPDENVMLLAGVLMDKSMDREIVETVFSDILNRGEDVKKPILQQIFKDKTHPCWADTAWILDVTGETPTRADAPKGDSSR